MALTQHAYAAHRLSTENLAQDTVSPLNLAHFSPVALRAHHSQAPFRIIFAKSTSYCETVGVLARPVVAETETPVVEAEVVTEVETPAEVKETPAAE